MRLYFLFLIIILFISSESIAQEFTYESVNKKTSELFSSKKWNELIAYGNKAIRSGFDFYYLRIRLGVAYYKNEKYFDAIKNFERALKFEKILRIKYRLPALSEYLYYSYIHTDRTDDANSIFFEMPVDLKNTVRPLNNTFVNDLNFEIGEGLSNDESKNRDIELDGPDNVFGEQTINRNYFYLNAGLRQLPFNIFSIYYDYTYLNRDKAQIIESNDTTYSYDYSQILNQFYNSINIVAAPGLIISPAGHYIGSKQKTIEAAFDSVTYVYNSSTMSYDSLKYYYTFTEEETGQNNFVASLSISKYISIFKFGITGSFSYLNSNHQTQYGIDFKIYPFGKINFFTNTLAILHYQNSIANLLITQAFGGRINKNLRLEGFATIGNMNNYNELNGFLVYNNGDVIKSKFGAELNYFFSNEISAFMFYEFQYREKEYLTVLLNGFTNNNPNFQQQLTRTNYNVNSLLAGFKINF